MVQKMSEKTTNNKKMSQFPSRCHRCQYFNVKKDKCKKHKSKQNTDFSQCDTFLVRESLVMY